MSHKIFVHNKSSHPQVFEVHGWNNNKNMTVAPHSTATINAPNGSSGAIIALHGGHEGEQAEITKDGFGGNDFFDLSNIVGAGGNMTVQQVGEPSTLKGDPLFMQHLNTAWKHASPATKHSLAHCVHLDGSGKVVRIDAIKDNPGLDPLIRTFADGKTYIGVGAWNGSPGNPNDNNQSRAGKGNKDIIVTYNDGDARPDGNPGTHHSPAGAYTVKAGDTLYEIAKRLGVSVDSIKAANPGVDPSKLHVGQVIHLPGGPPHQILLAKAIHPSSGDHDDGKTPGIILTNKSHAECRYFFYDNYWNGNGAAGANFDKPLNSVHLSAGAKAFVSLAKTFKGRVQRGSLIPATWVEFQIRASNDGKAHGDVSVEQGNDGPATIRSTDGSNHVGGFTKHIEKMAKPGAHVKRADGVDVIASTMGNWMGGPNQAAIDLQKPLIGSVAYVVGGTGVPDVASANNRFAVDFY